MLERKRLAIYAYEYTKHGQKSRRIGIVDIVGPTSIDTILKFLGYRLTYEFNEKCYKKENNSFTVYPEDVLIEVLKDPYDELFGGEK